MTTSPMRALPKRGIEFVEREAQTPAADEDLSTWLQRTWDDNVRLAKMCRDKHPDTFRMPSRQCFSKILRAVPDDHAHTAFAIFWMGYELREELLHSRITRRWLHDDPAELGIGLKALGRLQVFAVACSDDAFPYLYGDCIGDFAASDLVWRLAGDEPRFDFHYHLDQTLHDADCCLRRGDLGAVSELVSAIGGLQSEPAYYQQLVRWYQSVANRDAGEVASSLQGAMKAWARVRAKSESEFAFDIGSHARYWISSRVSPDLVHDFDISQKLPWDPGLYQWIRHHTQDEWLSSVEGLPAVLHELLAGMQVPDWLPGYRDI